MASSEAVTAETWVAPTSASAYPTPPRGAAVLIGQARVDRHQNQYRSELNGALMRHWSPKDNRVFMGGHPRARMNNGRAARLAPGSGLRAAPRRRFGGSRFAAGERGPKKGQRAQSRSRRMRLEDGGNVKKTHRSVRVHEESVLTPHWRD